MRVGGPLESGKDGGAADVLIGACGHSAVIGPAPLIRRVRSRDCLPLYAGKFGAAEPDSAFYAGPERENRRG
jgi:hypothetical protein